MFKFPNLSNPESEAVSLIDNHEPIYAYVTDRAEDLVKQNPDTHMLRMHTVELLAQTLRANVLPEIAGPFAHTLRADIIAEHYLATACKDLE